MIAIIKQLARLLTVVLVVVAIVGCQRRIESTVFSPAAAASNELPARIDAALAKAAAYLVERQSTDGAWRSDVYAPFREGNALTPLVVLALKSLPEEQRPETAIERGMAYLDSLVDSSGEIRAPQGGIAYPVYTAATALLVLADRTDEAAEVQRTAWVRYLLQRQLNEQLGWEPADAFYGGWGYAAEPTRRPSPGVPLSPLAEPNLSATVFALAGLKAAGAKVPSAAFAKAEQFVRRCQNLARDGAEPTRFDDGGFFFLQSDAVRNKAGIAGIDEQGRERFASYGSATADGVRGLQLCGVVDTDPAVVAGVAWLDRNFSAEQHPGDFETGAARNSVYFYYCYSLAELLAEYPKALESTEGNSWQERLAIAILTRQREDGSWKNDEVEVREDDPLVATSLAMQALSRCRSMDRSN